MQRLRIFGSGRVLLTNEKEEIIEDFIVSDPEKAQEIVMEYIKEKYGKDKDASEKM